MNALGVLEEAEYWLSLVTIPEHFKYKRFAYAYQSAPIWLWEESNLKKSNG
tara:strand:+ start:3621 stop:3773 length:153 start_codon:yes stop_codon:yes gene_type:complete